MFMVGAPRSRFWKEERSAAVVYPYPWFWHSAELRGAP